ncbi:MAG TPA: hypothetical protein VMU48_13915, partial [Terracidiphilus sp.]|nr:hypothetical protein [Terracidiphilus sp.]
PPIRTFGVDLRKDKELDDENPLMSIPLPVTFLYPAHSTRNIPRPVLPVNSSKRAQSKHHTKLGARS